MRNPNWFVHCYEAMKQLQVAGFINCGKENTPPKYQLVADIDFRLDFEFYICDKKIHQIYHLDIGTVCFKHQELTCHKISGHLTLRVARNSQIKLLIKKNDCIVRQTKKYVVASNPNTIMIDEFAHNFMRSDVLSVAIQSDQEQTVFLNSAVLYVDKATT